MKVFLPIAALLVALITALFAPVFGQSQPTADPAVVAEPQQGASEGELVTALLAMSEWLTSDFDQARPEAMVWIRNPTLPIDFRSKVLRSAIEAARSAN